jgi:hypothetical protein
MDNYNITLSDLTYDDILLGLSRRKLNIDSPEKEAIDTIILLLKRSIILQRTDKQILTVNYITSLINNRIRLEKMMHAKKHFIKKKWSQFVALYE